jgi:hypothetical protein
MKSLRSGTTRRVAVAGIAGIVAIGAGVGIAIASTSAAPPSNARHAGRGIPEYGMTGAFYKGTRVNFTYTKGYFCDTSVRSTASSKCEAGATFKKAPAKHFDPLYITVPLGFSRKMNMVQCPSKLVCVDHPGTIDLRRLEPALKPLYPSLTDKQLRTALANYPVPEHDHFITDLNGRKGEWWDVKVVGVTSSKVYRQIRAHRSYGYIAHLIKNKNKNVVGPIPTNLFLYFAAH